MLNYFICTLRALTKHRQAELTNNVKIVTEEMHLSFKLWQEVKTANFVTKVWNVKWQKQPDSDRWGSATKTLRTFIRKQRQVCSQTISAHPGTSFTWRWERKTLL